MRSISYVPQPNCNFRSPTFFGESSSYDARLAMNPNAPGFNFNAGASAAPPHATTRLAVAYHPNLHHITTSTTSTTLPECLGVRAVSQVRSSRAATASREATASLGSRSMWHATRHSLGEECFGRECQA